MSSSSVSVAVTFLLFCLFAIDAASAAPVYECQPVQVRLARVLPAEHGRLTVFSLTNLGDAPAYFPLSHSGELMRLPELHPSAYILSTRGSEIEKWSDNITLGSYDVWRGVLILQPGQTEDIGVPVDLAAIDRYEPDSMFKLEMYGIPTTCKVQSPGFFYRRLDELMFRKL